MTSKLPSVIASLSIHKIDSGLYDFTVSCSGQPLYEDAGFSSVTEAIVAAIQQEGPIRGFELSYGSIVIGTYLCEELKADAAGIADHAMERRAVLREN
ncbi:MAG: hypothetical protein Q7V20_23685 [Aquabacterium sp.]|uniref:hypothetical protein n=1 Tax=Aquabacterium sp. TaxID=1872578 RepID=UPI002715EFFD|nr:hypothetical protein [Aquabacterium sp.]MDO9006456.1 hypothetical protein [Aquabacterium sp.]